MEVGNLQQLIHDLRNRIAPIRNVIYLMRLRGSNDPKLGEAVAIIERQIEAMTQLLDEFSAATPAKGPAAGSDAAPSPAAVAPPETGSDAGGARARRILIADDSPAVCDSFAAILSDFGHEVRAVHNGLEAVDVATAWMPDFVLLDVNMPKLNGYEAARRLRELFPSSKMRLVMISGTDIDAGVLQAARQAGFDDCVDKLLDFSVLRRMLET